MTRVYNFSAGPATLPEEVLAKAAAEMLDYSGSGMSVMELSHRSGEFTEIIERAEATLRRLMRIPDDYSVLFLQGGASLQFAMVPMNLMSRTGKADYADTGNWSAKAIEEAGLFGEVHIAASSADRRHTYIPLGLDLSSDASYLHITSNNTLEGTRFAKLPDPGDLPLIADMSSEILSRDVDVERFGLIYAGAQKNIGPAGLTLVIIRTDLAGQQGPGTPAMLRYDVHCETKSRYNTPPCYSIYLAGLVFEWLERSGGVAAMQQVNEAKAQLLYDFLDNSSLFGNPVEHAHRSTMNVPFTTPSDELNEAFISQAAKAGLVSLRGHRLVGGMRASIYNAMPLAGVRALTEFMKAFERENNRGNARG